MTMKFCSLTSGSSGNCHYIGTDKTQILIDGGLSGKKIEGLLKGVGLEAENIDAIFVTHEHLDHIQGVGVLSRRYDLPIYANEGTWLGMKDTIGKIDPKNIKIFKTEEYFTFNDLEIKATKIYHDAREPVGYIINKNEKKISLVTDTGRLDDRIMNSIKDSDVYLIETNHDVQMVRNGHYPYHLQERVLSDFGHLSNVYTANALRHLVRAKGENIFLGHLSKDNNTPRTAFNEVAFNLMELGLDIKKDVKLRLTHREKQSDMIVV